LADKRIAIFGDIRDFPCKIWVTDL